MLTTPSPGLFCSLTDAKKNLKVWKVINKLDYDPEPTTLQEESLKILKELNVVSF